MQIIVLLYVLIHHSMIPETNSEEEGNDADGDYFQGDTVWQEIWGKRKLTTFVKIA